MKFRWIQLGSGSRALLRWMGLAVGCLAGGLVAGDEHGLLREVLTSNVLADELENLGLIHQDVSHPWLQEVWLLGRFHGHYHWAEGTAGESEAFEIRRLRMGGQVRLLNKMTLHAQMVSGSDADPFYNGFTELWAQWAFSPKVALTVGQQKHRFTHDRNVSSRYIMYLERSMLTNMFGVDYTPAVTLQGVVGGATYYTGVFSNATGGNMREAFTELDSGWSYLAAVYYDLGRSLGTQSAHVHLTYLHSEATERATNMDVFRDGLSSALILTHGCTSMVSEVTYGRGAELGDVVGLNVQPGFFVTDQLQLVFRYQLALSDGEQGLSPQRRYEEPAGMPRGDLYQAGYAGVNWYVARHRLKLMSGIEFATMGGEQVWTASTMLRFYFGPHSGGCFPMNQILNGFLAYD